MFADSDAMSQPFDLAYFGHEMSHQWWGNLVHQDGGGSGDMLSEGMAQYGSLQAVEAIDGPSAAAAYRSSGYPGYSTTQCRLRRDHELSNGLRYPAGAGQSGPSFSLRDEFACAKGFLVWDTLARTMGRDKFHQALRA